MARVDYFDDPEAPRPNAIVPAATAVVVNERGQVLLEQRTDNGLWALPGGALEAGETLAECILREVREETGLDIHLDGLVGIYSDPRHVIAYDDGEVRQEFSVCFRSRVIGGDLTSDHESTELRWVDPDALDDLAMHPTIKLRLQHYQANLPEPYVQ